MVVAVWDDTQCGKGKGWGVLRNGQKAGGLSLRVKRDERVGDLVVGWGGCECDGLVSNTLSLSFFFHNQFCGLLPVNLLAACQPHSLERERWGLSRYGLMPGRVE